ncbi:MAG: helix-turn-helix domain-containing protein [Chitinophagales bacterium]
MGNKKYHVDLTTAEQDYLNLVIENRSSKSTIVKRAYILLAADRNGDKRWTDEKIADAYKVRVRTIERLRERFVLESFEIALNGKKREVYKEKIFTGDVEAHLISLRCQPPPKGHKKWSLRLLADKMVELNYIESISYEGVRQILKKTN